MRTAKRSADSCVVTGVGGRLAVVGLAVVLAVAACGGDSDDERASATTTTAAPTTSTTVDPATLDTSGDDFNRIVRNIAAIRTAAYHTPRAELIDLIYASDCYCYRDKASVERLTAAGERYVDAGAEVLLVELISRNGDEAKVRYISRHGPQIIANRDAVQRAAGDGWAPTEDTYTLRLIDGRWRVTSIKEVGPA